MALDEPQENDLTFMDKEIQFLIDKDLSEKADPICVDFLESVDGSGFFKISSGLDKDENNRNSCGS
jgi:Fe-S cluster assembly iron-binding protein IscA